MSVPHNAGETITMKQTMTLKTRDVDFGDLTVTENWGRLLIKHGEDTIVVLPSAYKDLVAAISKFI